MTQEAVRLHTPGVAESSMQDIVAANLCDQFARSHFMPDLASWRTRGAVGRGPVDIDLSTFEGGKAYSFRRHFTAQEFREVEPFHRAIMGIGMGAKVDRVDFPAETSSMGLRRIITANQLRTSFHYATIGLGRLALDEQLKVWDPLFRGAIKRDYVLCDGIYLDLMPKAFASFATHYGGLAADASE